MNADEILATLKKLGKPQTAAIYKRHGAGNDVFGVLTAELVKIQKKIKCDHALAIDLWKTGNAEAQILALQIADPGKLTSARVEAWRGGPSSRFVSSSPDSCPRFSRPVSSRFAAPASRPHSRSWCPRRTCSTSSGCGTPSR